MPDAFQDWCDEVALAFGRGASRVEVPTQVPGSGVLERPGARPEVRVLDALALLAPTYVSDMEPEPGEQPEAAAPDTAPEAIGGPAQALAAVLAMPADRARGHLFVAWAQECRAAGLRVPAMHLPAILHAMTLDTSIRPVLVPVLGARGHWLAQHDKSWAAAVARGAVDAQPLPSDWISLDPASREAALRQARAHDPAAARQALEVELPHLPAKVRAELAATLQIGLSQDDEPLLEALLDDRSGAVRVLARNLLDELPGSRRAARLGAALRPLITTHGRLRTTVEVAQPGEPTEELRRDGLADPAQKARGINDDLDRIVRGAPLSTWTDATGLTPEAVIAGLGKADRERLLAAVRRQQDPAWVRAVVAHDRDSQSLMGLLPADEREDVVRRLLNGPVTELAGALGTLELPLGPETSLAVVRRLAGTTSLPRGRYGYLPPLVPVIHPSVVPQVLSMCQDLPDERPYARALQRECPSLTVRHTISEAFR